MINLKCMKPRVKNWREFWKDYRSEVIPEDIVRLEENKRRNLLLTQIGKTIQKEPISEVQFRFLIDSIVNNLKLAEEDYVLDLCCGNGLITREIARRVKFVQGLDFSSAMIDVARKVSFAPNIVYRLFDVNKLHEYPLDRGQKFSKVICYEALAYFTPKQFESMLRNLIDLTDPQSMLLFASVLNKKKRGAFFNTFTRKLNYLKMAVTRNDKGLGRWWDPCEAVASARVCGLNAFVFDQPSELHTAHYRFDLLLQRNEVVMDG